MGYRTEFTGELHFTTELTASQLAALKAMLGEDCRDHPEWNAADLSYIDLELSDDFSGLRWNDADKTYDLDQLVNVVIVEMRKKWPEFGLTGTLTARGEAFGDDWMLTIGEDGMAHKVPLELTSKIVSCPNCGCKFELEG